MKKETQKSTTKPATKAAAKPASKATATKTKTAAKPASKATATKTKTAAKTAKPAAKTSKPAVKTAAKSAPSKVATKTVATKTLKKTAAKVTPNRELHEIKKDIEEFKRNLTLELNANSKTSSQPKVEGDSSKAQMHVSHSDNEVHNEAKPTNSVPVATPSDNSTDNSTENSSNGASHNITIVDVNKTDKKPKKKLSPKAIAAIVIVSVVAIIAVLAISFTIFSGSALSKNGFGDVQILKTISIGEEPGIEPVVNLESLSTLNSIKEFSAAVIVKGNGKTVKEGDKVTVQYKQLVLSKYDFSTKPTSLEEAEASKFPDEKWQEYQNGWTAGSESQNVFDAKKPASTNAIKTGAEESGAQSNPQLDQIQELLIGVKVGAQIAVYMPPEASGVSGESEANSTPSQLLLFTVMSTGSAEDLANQQAEQDLKDQQAAVTADKLEKMPEISNFKDEGSVPEISVPNDFKAGDKIVVNVLQEGDGQSVKMTDTVEARYIGWLTNGTKFDSSWDHAAQSGKDTSSFALNRVIQGWKYGLAGLPVGSKVELIVPAFYAYGESSPSETVPENSDLIFYVEIVGVVDASSQTAQ